MKPIHAPLRGFGLVEIMITLVLGTLVIGGLYSTLVSNKYAYASIQATQRLDRKSALVLELLQSQLLQAGFQGFARIRNSLDFAASGSWAAGQYLSADDQVTGDSAVKSGTDRLFLRYFGAADGSIFDCQGNTVGVNTLIDLQLYLSPDDKLICKSQDGTVTVLEEGVENLQLGFHVAGEPASLVRYAGALSSHDWQQLSAIRVALLLSEPYLQAPAAAETYQLLEQSVSPGQSRYLRQVIDDTILLRN